MAHALVVGHYFNGSYYPVGGPNEIVKVLRFLYFCCAIFFRWSGSVPRRRRCCVFSEVDDFSGVQEEAEVLYVSMTPFVAVPTC